MLKKSKKLILVILCISTLLVIVASNAENKVDPSKIIQGQDVLDDLTKHTQKLELEGKEVPKELVKKEKWLDDYITAEKKKSAKNEEQTLALMQQRENAIKDEKGSPNMPENPYIGEEVIPYDDLGIFLGKQYYDGLYAKESEYEEYAFCTTSRSPYSILISGYSKKDLNDGIIYELKKNLQDVMDTQRNIYVFPDKGNIRLTSLVEDNTIVTFMYNDNMEGYYILSSSTAVFEPYQK